MVAGSNPAGRTIFRIDMDIEEATLLKLFEMRHGVLANNFHTDIEYNDPTMMDRAVGVNVYKNGDFVWSESAVSLLLWHTGKQLGIKE